MRKAALAFALFLSFWPLALHARTTATFAQKSVGTNCNNVENASDFDALAQCNSGSGAGTMQTAPIIVGTVTAPPYASTACDSGKAGMLQWTGTAMQYCSGSSWTSLGGASYLGDAATNTSPSRSDDVTTGLFSDTASTVSIATAGTERLRVTATGSIGVGTTTPKVSLDLSGKTDGIMLPTTTAAPGSACSSTYKGTLRYNINSGMGTTGSLEWCNGSVWVAINPTNQNGVCGSANGSSTASAPTTDLCAVGIGSSVAVSGPISWSWTCAGIGTGSTANCSATQSPNCTAAEGTECLDTTVYAGVSPDDGGQPMYTTHCDLGMGWTGSACTGTRNNYAWGTYGSTTGYTSPNTGRANTTGLAALGTSYAAAKACEDLSLYGQTDWYLPATSEISLFLTYETAIGNFLQTPASTYYWASTEASSSSAYVFASYYNNVTTAQKNMTSGMYVRCARR